MKTYGNQDCAVNIEKIPPVRRNFRLKKIVVVMCADTADEFGTGSCREKDGVTDVVDGEADGNGNLFEVHTDKRKAYINSRIRFYFFNCLQYLFGAGFVLFLYRHFGENEGVLKLTCKSLVSRYPVLEVFNSFKYGSGLVASPEIVCERLLFELCRLRAKLVELQSRCKLFYILFLLEWENTIIF